MPTTTKTLSIVSTVSELTAFLSSIPSSCRLYVDLEGYKLSRIGTISTITILIDPSAKLGIIDVLTLQEATFTTASNNNTTLKSIFEDPQASKCFWDVRNDADALWALYGVGLAGVTDIQLLENGSRKGDKTFLHGLDKSVQSDLKLNSSELDRWNQSKKPVQSLMSTDIFSVRPLDTKLLDYCMNDVLYLPRLRDIYLKRIEPKWLSKAVGESDSRAAASRSPNYDPMAATKAQGPWGVMDTSDGIVPCEDQQWEEALAALEDEMDDREQALAEEAERLEDELDDWADALAEEAERLEDELFNEDSDYYDGYEDTARDCIGWEEDMIRNGSPF